MRIFKQLLKNMYMKKNGLFLATLALGISATTAFAQPEKFVVIEEKTGTWCGWCPYGTVAMAELEEEEPNFIGIAIHNSDPMANSYYDNASTVLPGFTGYPYSCADRVEGAHAYESSVGFAARITETPVASIDVVGYVTGSELEIIVKADFAEKVSGDWRLAAVVVEDNVTGSGSGYAQRNYLSGGSPFSGAGHDWHTAPDPVPAAEMEYDHVARVIANNEFGGSAESLPDNIEVGVQWHSFTVALGATWDVSNLHVVGMLIEPDGSINNAGKGSVGTVGVEEIADVANFSINAYPNPAANFVNLSLELNEASTVAYEVIDMLGAVVYSQNAANLAAGTHINQIDLTELSNGMYFVKTTVNDTVELTKIQVQK
jgi:thiol-disulfide isomerase/thioredoxin